MNIIDHLLNAIIYEDGDRMSKISLQNIELIRKEAIDLSNNKIENDKFSIPLQNHKGRATFIGEPSLEEIDAVNKLADLAFKNLKKIPKVKEPLNVDVVELLKSRWKVIADYPGSDYHIGEILDRDWGWVGNDEVGFKHDLSHYPHLFKKLQWWEDRKPEEMPVCNWKIGRFHNVSIEDDYIDSDCYCEMCKMPSGEHESGCPNNIDPRQNLLTDGFD